MVLKEELQFTVSLPDTLRPFVEKLGTGSSLDEKIKLSVVIGLFTGKMITLERAAELANQPLSDFIDLLPGCVPSTKQQDKNVWCGGRKPWQADR